MASTAAFTPAGNTVTFVAGSTPPAPVQAVSTTLGGNQYLVSNGGTSLVILGYGTTSAAATASAANIITTGNGIPLLAGVSGTISLPPNAWFTGYSPANTQVYITPGDGL